MKSDSEALGDAVEILSGDGWIKGRWHADGKGSQVDMYSMHREKSCLLGALQLATEDQEQYERLAGKVGQVLKQTVPGLSPHTYRQVFPYNDQEATTQEDVLLLLKKTREEVEGEEMEQEIEAELGTEG